MRAVTKVVKMQQSGTMGAVTDKEFDASKNKCKICKYITTLCVNAEELGGVQKPFKCVWCGIDAYFVCRVCIYSKNKPIHLYLNTMQEKGKVKQLFFKWHDMNHFDI